MNTNRVAIIDLGTNTFHLLISEQINKTIHTLYSEKKASRIGKGGISNSILTEDAIVRALENIRYFSRVIDQYRPVKTYAIATSAFRNAKNGAQVAQYIYDETGIKIDIISGDQEAEFIYYGVRQAVAMGMQTSLIVDIGGGSVEFIICNENEIFWKKSIEIGGQRLIDKFQKNDPITKEEIQLLNAYFDVELKILADAVQVHTPTLLIGSSGSFDTISEMDIQYKNRLYNLDKEKKYTLSLESFYFLYNELIQKNRNERMQMPGMIELRVDMIVVSVILIKYLLEKFSFKTIHTSTYAMKEGVMSRMLICNN